MAAPTDCTAAAAARAAAAVVVSNRFIFFRCEVIMNYAFQLRKDLHFSKIYAYKIRARASLIAQAVRARALLLSKNALNLRTRPIWAGALVLICVALFDSLEAIV